MRIRLAVRCCHAVKLKFRGILRTQNADQVQNFDVSRFAFYFISRYDKIMLTTIISAIAAIIASAGAIYLTKQKEREAVWRAKKLAYYEEFFGAASGIVGETSPPDTKIRFATAVNNLHLIASNPVIEALHAFTDEIAVSNAAIMTKEQHDRLWSRLVWQIRNDLDDPPSKHPDTFSARLWASGVSP